MCKEVRSTVQFSSVAQLCLTLRPHALQHTRPPCPPPSPGVYSNSCPLSWWCHSTILPSVVPFSSCLQSFPESGSFPVSRFLTSGGHIIGVSASASVLPMNIQDWFPLGWMGWISLQSKGLSRVFSNTTVQKHPFFSAQGMAHDGSLGEDGKKWHGVWLWIYVEVNWKLVSPITEQIFDMHLWKENYWDHWFNMRTRECYRLNDYKEIIQFQFSNIKSSEKQK